MYLYVSNNDTVPNDNNDPPELLELLISKHCSALEDLTRYFAKIQTKQSIADYLYVSNNDKVPNDNNDPPELLELLLSKHWRMSD